MKTTTFGVCLSLGLIQFLTPSNQLLSDQGCCETPCCEATIVPGEPLDPCLIAAGYPYPAGIELCDGWDVYAKGDFLYWINNLGVPIFQVSATTINQQHTRELFQKRSWDPGFRVAIGANLGSVVVEAKYLSIHNHNTTHFSARSGETLSFPFPAPIPIPGTFATVKSKAQVYLDTVQVSVQKPFYIGKRLTLNAIYAFLYGWSQQNLNIAAAPPNIAPTAFGKAKQKWWNVGPSWGLHSKMLLGWGFRGIGNMDLSVSYARTSKSYSKFLFPNTPAANLTLITKDFASDFTIDLLGELGLSWEGFFFCDAYHTELAVTYNFYQHNTAPIRGLQFLTPNIDCWHGIAVSCRVDF